MDDEDSILDLLTEFFSSHGFKTLRCISSLKVMEMLKDHPVEVLLMDHSMPVKTGLSLVKEIEEFSQTTRRPIQVIMLTAQMDGKVALELAKTQILAYVNKPPKLHVLLALVKQGIQKYQELASAS